MHSFTSCLVHCVWSTKNREPCLTPDLRERLWPYLGGIAKQNQMKALAIGGANDHVHILLSLPATLSVAKAMQFLKGNSSKWIRETFPKMHSFAWQEGYGAFSVGISGVEPTIAISGAEPSITRSNRFARNLYQCFGNTVLRTRNQCAVDEFFRPCRDSTDWESVYPALKRWAIFDFVTSRTRREISGVDSASTFFSVFSYLLPVEKSSSSSSFKRVTRAVPAVFESQMNKPRGAKVQRPKLFYHDYEKNNFSINDARSCFACSPAGAGR